MYLREWLQTKTQELSNAYQNLQTQEEELRQNAEELQAINEALSSTKLELEDLLRDGDVNDTASQVIPAESSDSTN